MASFDTLNTHLQVRYASIDGCSHRIPGSSPLAYTQNTKSSRVQANNGIVGLILALASVLCVIIQPLIELMGSQEYPPPPPQQEIISSFSLALGSNYKWERETDEVIDPKVAPWVTLAVMKVHGNTTASGMGCSVRTAGLDPRPIGDSGSVLKVGTVAPKLLRHQEEEETIDWDSSP